MGELDRGLERWVGDPNHDRRATVDRFDGMLDQSLALLEAEIGVLLGFDAGGDDHGGTAVLDHVIDLTPERGPVDLEIGREGSERRNDQSRRSFCFLPARELSQTPIECFH